MSAETRTQALLYRTTCALATGLAAIVLPLYAIKVHRKQDYTDFLVYYKAARRVQLGQWSEIYTLSDGASPFRYAPPLLPLFRPFAEFTLQQASLIWYLIQFTSFAFGLVFLERSLRLAANQTATTPRSQFITALAFLFILRFCLDCFTIGQTSSLLFLGYCVGLWAWMSRRPGIAGTAVLIPSAFKIGPGFLFSLFAVSDKPRERLRALGAPLIWSAGAVLFLRFWCGSGERFSSLWSNWAEIVAKDSVYYDASHYGSQSIKSALLRAVNSGWLSAPHAQLLYVTIVVSGCLAILGFWLARKPSTPLGRGAFYALGIFPYLWFMPETFKYSLTTLAIPVALLLLQCLTTPPRQTRLTQVALVLTALSLSIAGLDIVGAKIFFGLQRTSVPLVMTLLLGAATWRLALAQSSPTWGPSASG